MLLIALLLGLEVWWKQDVVFCTPNVHLYCDFLTPVTYNSSSNTALAQLYRHLVIDSLHKPLYAAILAGYRASFNLTTSCFTIKLYGYSNSETMMLFIGYSHSETMMLFINTAIEHARKIGKMHLL